MRSPIRAFWFQSRESDQCWLHHIRIGAAVALVVAGWSSRGWAQEAKDILWYGNSFTNAVCCGSMRSVPSVVADVAVAAGHVAPRNRNASVDAPSLDWHRTNNTAVISSGIAAGQQWEHVVLQDTSTQPTHVGNLALHRSSTVAMYNLVAAHSPAVVPVLYKTWALGPGYSFYTGVSPLFPGGPPQMQAEVRQGYQLSTADINAAGHGRVAAGASWRRVGARRVSSQLLRLDIFHAQNRGTLLNALVLYGTIYEDTTTADISLTSVLTTLGLAEQDGQLLTTIADAIPVPEPATLATLLLGVLLVQNARLPQAHTASAVLPCY
jgi:hypothetical protein